MENFYDLAVFFLGDLPSSFTFLYPIFAVVLATMCVSIVFLFFKMCFKLIGV